MRTFDFSSLFHLLRICAPRPLELHADNVIWHFAVRRDT
jgi:hypothetical protein